MFSKRLGERLLWVMGAALPGCASGTDGEVSIPQGSSTVAVTAAPSSSGPLELPTKDPREAMWKVPGHVCMPAWATRDAPKGSCGASPGAWFYQGPRDCPGCAVNFSPTMTESEKAKHGPDACCFQEYPRMHHHLGRPLLGPDGPVVADLDARSAGLASEWERDALLEHASAAAFATLALELLGLGAPARLLREAHEAARDELRHAEICFALARAAGGAVVRPGRLPIDRARPLARDRVELVLRAVEEGCIGEAFAAADAYEASRRAADPEVRLALAGIAADEARHAELAARVAAWGVRTASFEERARIADGLLSLRTRGAAFEDPEGREHLGRLGATTRRHLWDAVTRDVVTPVLNSLFTLAAAARPSSRAALSPTGSVG